MPNTRLQGFTFAQIPIWLLAANDVDPQAKIIYGYLVWRQGQHSGCWPSVACIAADLQLSPRSIMRNLQQLEARAYIQVERSSGRSNFYIVNGEAPAHPAISQPLQQELHLATAPTPATPVSAPTPVSSTTPVSAMSPVSSTTEVRPPNAPTSDIHDTPPVTSMSGDQCHPCHPNHIKEPYPGTIEEDVPNFWKNVLDELVPRLSADKVATLRAGTRAERTDGRVTIYVSTNAQLDWLAHRAGNTIAGMINEELGVEVETVFKRAEL